MHPYDPSRQPYQSQIPSMRPSGDTSGGQSPTPIFDALYSEYLRAFRALPGDRSGEEDLAFTAFGHGPYSSRASHTGYGGHSGQLGQLGQLGHGGTGQIGQVGPLGQPGHTGHPGHTGQLGHVASTGHTGPMGQMGHMGYPGQVGGHGQPGPHPQSAPPAPSGGAGHTGVWQFGGWQRVGQVGGHLPAALPPGPRRGQ